MEKIAEETMKAVQKYDIIISKNDERMIHMRKKVEKKRKPKSASSRQQESSKVRSLRLKLIISFLIPVVFIIALGAISYIQVSDAMVKQYEKTASDAMNANSNYMNLITKGISHQAVRIMSDSNYSSYYERKHKSVSQANTAYRTLKANLVTSSVTVDSLQNIIIIGDGNNSMSNGNVKVSNTYFDQFVESEEGKLIVEDNSFRYVWKGYHVFADEVLGLDPEDYGLALIREGTRGKTYLFVDVKKSSIVFLLDEMHMTGGYTALISADNREIYSSKTVVGEEGTFFQSQDFFQEAKSGKEEKGHSIVTIEGEDYLFLYQKLEETGAMFCNLIPRKLITSNARTIGNTTIVLTLIAAIVAICIGGYISNGIGRTIRRMVKIINQVSEGDLTARFTTRRNDEFQVLSIRLSAMLDSMQKLIQEVANVSTNVLNSATELDETTDNLLVSSKDISTAINEMATGASQQVCDSDDCVGQMDDLSSRINDVVVSTREIDQIFETTKNKVGNGISVVNDLNQKVQATIQATNIITNGIEELEQKSISIEGIVKVINDISEQTDLLSLNASIEAARAGEAGKGFSIVAEEIRKLAAKSMEAASEIALVISDIQAKTKETADSARSAEEMISTQEEVLKNTVDVFSNINTDVNILVNHMSDIKACVDAIEKQKVGTIDSIQDILAVSEESAASAEQINSTTINQTKEMAKVSKAAAGLAKDASLLQEAIQKFTV